MNKKNLNVKLTEKKQLISEITDIGGMIAQRLNLAPIVGQIYILLYLSSKPLFLNEMVEKLNISKASASINIRYLESWGAVKKVWTGGGRRDYYVANEDILGIFINRLFNRFSDIIDRVNFLEKKIKSVDDKFLKNRYENIKNIYDIFIKKIFLLENNKKRIRKWEKI